VNVPTDDPDNAFIERVDVATVFGRGVIGEGRVYEIPLGAEPCQDAERETKLQQPSFQKNPE
jgi:hypothetical protein